MFTKEEKRIAANTRARASWKKRRDEKLLADGIDPDTRPISKDGKRGKAINECKRDLPAEIKFPRNGESEDEFKKRYQSEVKKRYYERNKERLREEKRNKYAANHEHELKVKLKWRLNNPTKQKEYDKRHIEKNPERIKKLNQWRLSNPDRLREVREKWYSDNPQKNRFYSSKWRKECRKATPLWANWEKIAAIYDESIAISKKTGIPHHVDHIVPVQGKNITGLHVHQNLRIIPATENVKKRAKVDEDLIIDLMKSDWKQLEKNKNDL